MSVEENKAFIRRYLAEVLADKSDTSVNRFVSDENLKRHIQMFEAAFPGYQLSQEDLIAEDDKVVVRSVMTGIHQGELMGIGATGKQVSISAIIIYQIAEGKIVGFWINADILGLLQQLGVIPLQG